MGSYSGSPMKTCISAVFSLSISALFVHAGTTFTYQGRLNDVGAPANGVYQMTFRLFNAASGPQQLAGFTFFGVMITNGIFDVTLDYGSEVFDGSARWLEIGVRTNGSTAAFVTLTPRQPITSSPYAIVAERVSGPISDSQLSANIPRLNVPATFAGPITAPAFNGDGSALISVNAVSLEGFAAQDFWKINGNSGTTVGTHFLGTTDNQPLEFRVNGVRALRLEPTTNGLPNLIGGSGQNVIEPGSSGATIGGGGGNIIKWTSHGALISGGAANVVDSSRHSTVGGGHGNNVLGTGYGLIGGGQGNSMEAASHSMIGGGMGNTVHFESAYITVSGGISNLAGGTSSTIGGGDGNMILRALAGTVAGGRVNVIYNRAEDCTIGGGHGNFINFETTSSTIAGGHSNRIDQYTQSSTISGGTRNLINSPSTIGFHSATISGGNGNSNFSSYATIAGGHFNTIDQSSYGAAISGGEDNTISSYARHATISGGAGNTIEFWSWNSTIGGGNSNRIANESGDSVIAGGRENGVLPRSIGASIGGGYSNSVQPNTRNCTIGGGEANCIDAYNDNSTIGGGNGNRIALYGVAGTIGGGSGNWINGGGPNTFQGCTISGGIRNSNSGHYATIPGGLGNYAVEHAFAAGTSANAAHRGALFGATPVAPA